MTVIFQNAVIILKISVQGGLADPVVTDGNSRCSLKLADAAICPSCSPKFATAQSVRIASDCACSSYVLFTMYCISPSVVRFSLRSLTLYFLFLHVLVVQTNITNTGALLAAHRSPFIFPQCAHFFFLFYFYGGWQTKLWCITTNYWKEVWFGKRQTGTDPQF